MPERLGMNSNYRYHERGFTRKVVTYLPLNAISFKCTCDKQGNAAAGAQKGEAAYPPNTRKVDPDVVLKCCRCVSRARNWARYDEPVMREKDELGGIDMIQSFKDAKQVAEWIAEKQGRLFAG
ncbi:hypothetical protein E6O75_ATG10404 [Venturia nashicola]|uniref:Uncharacterized protein n=1 Tax=Venturia nashicola TaxID=86259 RepID=A0A4Z1P0X9_9PEZI|nr:hypothetical protein E6O75_ATG10404 [Venturia nashicola]